MTKTEVRYGRVYPASDLLVTHSVRWFRMGWCKRRHWIWLMSAQLGCEPDSRHTQPQLSTSGPSATSVPRTSQTNSLVLAKADVPTVHIPRNSYSIGNQGDSFPTGYEGRRRRQVEAGPFAVDRSEVTVAAYATCVRANVCALPTQGDLCNFGKIERGDHPVNCVSRAQAETFCNWMGRRLPTEDEWELMYARWNSPPKVLDACMNQHQTCSIESGVELSGVAGNVAEWVIGDFCEARSGCHPSAVVRGRVFHQTESEAGDERHRGPGARAAAMRKPHEVGFRCISDAQPTRPH